MVARALSIYHLGHGQLRSQEDCVLSDWQPLLVVIFAHCTVLALAELGSVAWQG